ncbi:MAG: hypothetical protein K2V38_02040, partial [Gemmataceae bacterium]|nr:hypothetical protein [Gemmataceae bacterium]
WSAVDTDVGAGVAAWKRAEKPFALTPKAEGLPRVRGAVFERDGRGFLGVLQVLNAEAFVADAPAAFRAAPVSAVTFQGLTAEEARAFVDSGLLARVRTLKLNYDVEGDAVRALGESPDVAGVRKLECDPVELFREVAEGLAAGRHWTGLEELSVYFPGDPDPEATAELLGRPQFRTLRTLRLCEAAVDDGVVRVIAKKLPALRRLDLTFNEHITGAGVSALAASKSLTRLRWLDLGAGDLTDATAAAELINTKSLPALTHLHLGANELKRLDAKALAKTGRGPSLRALNLSGAKIGGAGLEALAGCPAARGLWYLSLENTNLTDDAFERFLAHAAFDGLVALDLSGNELTAASARALAAWPGAASLQWLDLGRNAIGESGARALAASPNLAGLKYVRFSGRGTAVLKKRFKKAFRD